MIVPPLGVEALIPAPLACDIDYDTIMYSMQVHVY